MSCYILSTNNRFYAATESAYGTAPAIAAANRIPAVRLKAKQEHERVQRRDKTGSRTWAGLPPGTRTRTTFGLNTYMTTWSDTSKEPAHGPLISASLGAPAQIRGGAVVQSVNGARLTFTAAHGLSAGQAVSALGEIRFVMSVPDATSVILNVAFTAAVSAGTVMAPTATYRLSTKLPSVSIFDYWTPDTAVQRLVPGCAVDQFTVQVNGDFHEFSFSGPAADVVDSSSFEDGQAGLSAFPDEPASSSFDYSIIPGHLGQAWIGATPAQFYTLTAASVQVQNNIDQRTREFGSNTPKCFAAGVRKVSTDFTVFANDHDETKALYEAARSGSPVSLMIQLGNRQGQLFAIYVRAVVPVVPEFDDSETRLQWTFRGSRGQGVSDDEIVVAFS